MRQQNSRIGTAYERFEQIVSCLLILLISVIIIYSFVLVSINLYNQLTLDTAFPDTTALKDVFGSIMTILILVEFNHSIAWALIQRTGVLHVRYVVLIAILVIARKVILLDFTTTSFETLVGISAIALGFGLLYWLVGTRARVESTQSELQGGADD